jgi:hypothetical protein
VGSWLIVIGLVEIVTALKIRGASHKVAAALSAG